MQISRYMWTPGVGIGPIKFQSKITELISSIHLEECVDRFDEIYDSQCYKYADDKDDDLLVYLDEARKVDSVSVDSALYFEGHNLIGLSLEKISEYLEADPDELEEKSIELPDGDTQSSAEFYNLGLQVWLQDGVVVGAFVREILAEDD